MSAPDQRPSDRSDADPAVAFDPAARLAGPPEPWTSTSMPTLRPGPPYHMTDMISAEPALARRILDRLSGATATIRLAAAIRDAAAAGAPIVVTGCGTSEHGALGAVEILRAAMRSAGVPGPGPVSAQAFEAALDPQRGGLLIGISHEGATGATNRAMEVARDAGVTVALVTVSDRSPGAAIATIILATEELDQSWCHTVGYLSPLLAAAAVGAELTGQGTGSSAIEALLAAGLERAGDAESAARTLASSERLIVLASGADRPAGRELALKIEEAAWVPTAYRDLETYLHGHLPANGEPTGLILLLADRAGRDERVARARQALAAARAIGVRSAAIVTTGVSAALDPALTPAGRIVAPDDASLPGPVGALFATATPLQLFTERLARARRTNPDPIRRDDPRYLAAADAAEA